MKFNLQQFLTDMEERLGGKIDAVDGKVDTVVKTINDHETRLSIVENGRRQVRWVIGTFVGGGGLAVIVAIWDYVTSHLK